MRADLDALVELEASFEGDRLRRSALARLLTRPSADVWVASFEDGTGPAVVVGDAIVLYRTGFASARLYTLAVAPSWRGRGVARALLERAEEGAKERGVVALRLEVRVDNEAAIRLYRARGYEVLGTTHEYYEDGSTALRMRKRFVAGGTHILAVPYYPQSLDFTCGPAALMMAMRFHGDEAPLGRAREIELWRLATTIFMQAGHGGCSSEGLAVAAMRAGFPATVVSSDADVPFLDGVRSPVKKDVIRLSHQAFSAELVERGSPVQQRDFRLDEVVDALRDGLIPLLLVSGYRLYAQKVPHWVTLTGFDAEHVYLHDPHVPDGTARADSVHLALPRGDFEAVSRYGRRRHRSMVLIGGRERSGRGSSRRSGRRRPPGGG